MHGQWNAWAQSHGEVGVLCDGRKWDYCHTNDTVFAKDCLVLGHQLDLGVLPVLKGASGQGKRADNDKKKIQMSLNEDM